MPNKPFKITEEIQWEIVIAEARVGIGGLRSLGEQVLSLKKEINTLSSELRRLEDKKKSIITQLNQEKIENLDLQDKFKILEETQKRSRLLSKKLSRNKDNIKIRERLIKLQGKLIKLKKDPEIRNYRILLSRKKRTEREEKKVVEKISELNKTMELLEKPIKVKEAFVSALMSEVEKRMEKLGWIRENRMNVEIKYGISYFLHRLEAQEKGEKIKETEKKCLAHGWYFVKQELQPPKHFKFDSSSFQKLIYDTYKDVIVSGTKIIDANSGLPIFSGFGQKVGNAFEKEEKPGPNLVISGYDKKFKKTAEKSRKETNGTSVTKKFGAK